MAASLLGVDMAAGQRPVLPHPPVGIDSTFVPSIVRQNPDPKLAVKIVSQRASRDGRDLVLTVQPAKEEFKLELDFTGTRLKRLTVVVIGRKPPAQLEYTLVPRYRVDLLETPGVAITSDPQKTSIAVETRVLRILPPRGVLRYKAEPPPDPAENAKKSARKPK